jgi:hypothetical protein
VRAHSATLATLRTGKLLVGAVPRNPSWEEAVEGGESVWQQRETGRAMPIDAFRLDALLRAGAPALACLDASVSAVSLAEATHMLEAQEAPLGALRVRELLSVQENAAATEAAVRAFLAALRGRGEACVALCCVGAWLRAPGALEALVDAAGGLRALHVRVPAGDAGDDAGAQAAAPGPLASLARLVGGNGRLEALSLEGCARPLTAARVPPAGDVAALCGALRASTSLTSLSLHQAGVWVAPPEHGAAALLRAAKGHPSLRALALRDELALPGAPRGLQPPAARALTALAARRRGGRGALTKLHVGWWEGTARAGSGGKRAGGGDPLAERAFAALRSGGALRALSVCDLRHEGAAEGAARAARERRAEAAAQEAEAAEAARRTAEHAARLARWEEGERDEGQDQQQPRRQLPPLPPSPRRLRRPPPPPPPPCCPPSSPPRLPVDGDALARRIAAAQARGSARGSASSSCGAHVADDEAQ